MRELAKLLLQLLAFLLMLLAGFFLFPLATLAAWPLGVLVLAGFWLLLLAGEYWQRELLKATGWLLLLGSGFSCFYLYDRLSGSQPAAPWLAAIPGPLVTLLAVLVLLPFWFLLPLWAQLAARLLRGESPTILLPGRDMRFLVGVLGWCLLLLGCVLLVLLLPWQGWVLAGCLLLGMLFLLWQQSSEERLVPLAPGLGLFFPACWLLARALWPAGLPLWSWSGIGLLLVALLVVLLLLGVIVHLGWVLRGRPVPPIAPAPEQGPPRGIEKPARSSPDVSG
ncbi:hypothetical protein [Chitinilyticum piscinae]|uniref:Uncharacterized protein n=1 Tax=Chitinilyticum piscinae TaxID=2866724 RepID=A0A8J7K1W6_9NEIS|nr:hypothetical protein [Chitinilyticum piscinae]MBE9609791.1 hypothetical protein [Chitinilyticum piscinae]